MNKRVSAFTSVLLGKWADWLKLKASSTMTVVWCWWRSAALKPPPTRLMTAAAGLEPAKDVNHWRAKYSAKTRRCRSFTCEILILGILKNQYNDEWGNVFLKSAIFWFLNPPFFCYHFSLAKFAVSIIRKWSKIILKCKLL